MQMHAAGPRYRGRRLQMYTSKATKITTSNGQQWLGTSAAVQLIKMSITPMLRVKECQKCMSDQLQPIGSVLQPGGLMGMSVRQLR